MKFKIVPYKKYKKLITPKSIIYLILAKKCDFFKWYPAENIIGGKTK